MKKNRYILPGEENRRAKKLHAAYLLATFLVSLVFSSIIIMGLILIVV